MLFRRALLITACALTATSCEAGPGQVAFLSIGTGGTGGVYYPLGGGLANALSAGDSTRRYTAEVTGGSVENVNRVVAGQIDMGFSLAVAAWEELERDPNSPLRIAAPLYPNLLHVLVRESEGIESIADLAGLRVSVGSAGSGTERISEQVLAAWGLTYEEVNVQFLSFGESASALRDGALDAAIISVGYPASAVLDATSAGGIQILPIDEAGIARVIAAHPYYSRGVIPTGVYPGVDAEVPTLAMMNWVVVNVSEDESVVLQLLNILGDPGVSFARVHPMARQIDIEALNRAPIPLHGAAEAWLRERE